MAYLVTGRSDTGETHPRLEIRKLQEDPEQWTLFILGLSALYGQKSIHPFPEYPPIPEPIQWINMSGIHGLPFQRWPGDPSGPAPDASFHPGAQPDAKNYGGYCNHGSILFPTWHRPTLMLLEQAIGYVAVDLATKIGNQYPNEKDKWQLAAKKLRLPFWDWLDPRTGTEGVPRIFVHPTIDIHYRNVLAIIPNPLATFRFGATRPDGFQGAFAVYPRTLRHPTTGDARAQDNIDHLNSAFTTAYKTDLAAPWAHLLTVPTGLTGEEPIAWDAFSNTNPSSLPEHHWRPYRGSIEAPHNAVHMLAGGGDGHMSNVPVSGFDPLFWMHHVNVDRLIMQWMSFYPTYWMGKGYKKPKESNITSFQQPGSTYNHPVSQRPSESSYNVDESSDLPPYRKADGSYWTSLDTISQNSLYYDYGHYLDPTEADKKRAELQRLYGLDPLADAEILKNHKSPIFHSPVGEGLPRLHKPVDHYRTFLIDVELLEHAFSGSYQLVLYTQSDERIGGLSVFTRTNDAGCAACRARREAGVTVRGIIALPPLTVATILENGSWDEEDEEVALEHLKGSLKGEILRPGGRLIAHCRSTDPSLPLVPLTEPVVPKISLRSAYAAHPEGWKEGPIELYGWKQHGDVVPAGTWYSSDSD